MLMDHHPAVVEAVEADDAVQQQLVRERLRRIKAAAELGLARSSRGRQWGRALGRRALLLLPKQDDDDAAARQPPPPVKKATLLEAEARGGGNDDHDEQKGEEEVVVEEKVALLRRLVPGGEDMEEVEGLLEETADYIAALKAQVGVMRALACMLSGAGLDALPEKAGAGQVTLTQEK